MNYQYLLLEISDRIATVTINRPDKLNALSFAVLDEIESIFSGGPNVDITTLVSNLNRMAPTKRSNWNNIKF